MYVCMYVCMCVYMCMYVEISFADKIMDWFGLL